MHRILSASELWRQNTINTSSFNVVFWSLKEPGRDGGQVVSMLAFYSKNPNSNPADAYSFSVRFALEKSGNKQKEAVVCTFLKITKNSVLDYQLIPSYLSGKYSSGANLIKPLRL